MVQLAQHEQSQQDSCVGAGRGKCQGCRGLEIDGFLCPSCLHGADKLSGSWSPLENAPRDPG